MLKKISFIFCLFAVLGTVQSCKKEVDRAQTDKEIIEKYIQEKEYVAKSLPSGLYYTIIKEGNTKHPLPQSNITINYKGYLVDGKIFDQTSTEPRTFFLNQLILGWQQGLPLIGEGGKIRLYVPSSLGYGEHAKGAIPANSVLIFDIDLISVNN